MLNYAVLFVSRIENDTPTTEVICKEERIAKLVKPATQYDGYLCHKPKAEILDTVKMPSPCSWMVVVNRKIFGDTCILLV